MPQNTNPALRLIKALKDIPKTTTIFLVLNVALFAGEFVDLKNASLRLKQVYRYGEWYRLFLAPVHHLDREHLVYNMLSFLYLGPRLERHMGGGWMFCLVCVFALLSGLVYLLLKAFMALADSPYAYRGTVGFSGVLFGLSVLTHHYNPDGVIHIGNFLVPNRYAVWVKLFYLSAINTRTSFVGHFAGILVGLLYTMGPLETIMKKCAGLVSSVGDFIHWLWDLIDGVRGIRHWAREEVRIDELRNNRLRRFEGGPN